MNGFISYVNEDLEIATKLRNDLKDKGYLPFIDKDILPGQNRNDTIKEAIRGSSFFLALLSSNSISKRGSFQIELKLALDILKEFPKNGIFLIPVHLDNAKLQNEELMPLQWADLSDYQKGLEKILKALEALKAEIPQQGDSNNNKQILHLLHSLEMDELDNLKEEMIEKMESSPNIYETIKEYLSKAPMEDAKSEHFLMVMRRYIISYINSNNIDGRELIFFVLEPAVIQEIKQKENKEINEIKYEIARFLSEWGKYSEAISTFEEICRSSEENSLINLYAKNGIAIALQNLGLFDTSCTILKNLIESILPDYQDDKYNDIKYFVFKHYATILRRIYFNELLEKKEEILDCFKKAEKYYATYHINFSRGYFYYLLKDYNESKKEYEICKKKLEKNDDEYYGSLVICGVVKKQWKVYSVFNCFSRDNGLSVCFWGLNSDIR